MSRIKLVINGETLMDESLGQWQQRPPTAIQHLLQPKAGRKAETYMQAALGALLEAVMTEQDTLIEATTTPTGWVVRSTHMAKVGAG